MAGLWDYLGTMTTKLTLSTSKEGFFPITRAIQELITREQVDEGICLVFCPHTTAGITINEHADRDVVHDMLIGLGSIVTEDSRFRHAEGNSTAHLKASIVGSSVMVPIAQGRLVLGTWQGIWFCEFDGPRERAYLCTIIRG